MSVKKSKGTGKTVAKKKSAKKAARKSAKKSSGKKKPMDIVKVRENIDNLVKASAKDIANEVIKVAKTGQLASAKYLFEAVGLYPPTEETAGKPQGDSLAQTLLNRLGLPTEPVICDEDSKPAGFASDAKGVDVVPDRDDEDATESGEVEQEPLPSEGDE